MMMMKAIELTSFKNEGKSSRIVETTKPSIENAPNSVLVKVIYSALDTALDELTNKTMLGSYLHDLKATPLIPGNHFSGVIEATGSNVASTLPSEHSFQVGDLVFGHLQYEPTVRQGSCSEYLVVPTTDLAKLPPNSKHVSLELAAASTTEGMTAMQALRDVGQLQANRDSVLIIGGGGGVGSMAVGIAKQLQALKVTAVCSTKDVDKVKGYGADEVMDRTKSKIEKWQPAEKFNLIFDSSGRYGFLSLKHLLQPGGRVVSTQVHMDTLLFGNWLYPVLFSGKTAKVVLCRSKKEDLEILVTWLESRAVSVSIDSIYNVSNFEKARERQNDPQKEGRVVIKVDSGWH
ncbi:hypothetical protein ACA910_002798 [Epithemia clementina (nom. ined.)]